MVEINQLTKEESREQFERMTKDLGIKHTFSFDEAWSFLEARRNKYRNVITELESKIRTDLKDRPGVLLEREKIDEHNPVKHTFADGLYIREIFNPRGELIITKIHKVEHTFFLLKGDMSITTEHGLERIKAPYYGITKPGTKRVIFTHEDCVFVTVHANPNNTRDIGEIEKRVIAESFCEIDEDKKKEDL